MKSGLLTWLASWLITLPLHSQFTDDFSDGNLDGWQGDVSHFVITPGEQLQLTAPVGTTTAWLYTPVVMTDSMVWDIYVKLDFAPSTSNQLRIYLGLDDPDLSSASGYFLEMGASGDMDPVDLVYLNQGSSQILASSAPGIAAAEPVELRLRILKKSIGVWEIYRTEEAIPEFLFGTTHDLLPVSSLAWFGVYCRFTDTRRDKFFFDDISIAPLLPDTQAPQWTGLQVLSDRSLQLEFDEIVDETSATDVLRYTLQPGEVHPQTVTWMQNKVQIDFDVPFMSQQEYTLLAESIRDAAGNAMPVTGKTFTYLAISKAEADELLITEIMADPSPVIGLPDAEYLEIYNATDRIFQLADYTLTVGSSQRSLPGYLLFGGSYVILCNEENQDLLSTYGPVAVVPSMPSLTNSGTSLLIHDTDDRLIHEVRYTSAWYQDPAKSDGGWSLEMKNPKHVCSGAGNWSAANNLLGGTPGSTNTQWSLTPDQEGPGFISLFTPSADLIHLRFSEKLDELLMDHVEAYTIQPAVSITDVGLTDEVTLEIRLSTPLQPGIIYELLAFDAFDCLGNMTSFTDPLTFGLVTQAEPGDVILHEILFNPGTGGSRFLEIYNASSKFIDLGTLSVGRLTPGSQDIYATGLDEIMKPGDIVVLSPDREDILARYQVPIPQKLYDAPLPSWDEDADHVALIAGGIVLDSFTYSSDWHHPVIADQNGVSLERVSVQSPTSHRATWHSAAALQGYATPTGPNSQQVPAPVLSDEPFTITHSSFSPNGDGYKDFLALNFQLPAGDLIGSVWIYDLEGREINILASNESFGTSDILQWDGRDASGRLADTGIYVIFIQLWDPDGSRMEYQETCALVQR